MNGIEQTKSYTLSKILKWELYVMSLPPVFFVINYKLLAITAVNKRLAIPFTSLQHAKPNLNSLL